MKFRGTLILLFFLLFCIDVYSEANIYLFSKVQFSDGMKLSDIGKIEQDDIEEMDLGALYIDKSLFNDGLIDRKELRSYLNNIYTESINIYGTGTRIIFNESRMTDDLVEINDGKIESGISIKIILKNNKIRLVTSGTALKDGKVGDIIPIKLKSSKVVKGVIVRNKTVEISL